RIARRYGAPLVYVNQIGGNDELLFDGSSIVIDANGETIFCAPAFEEHGSLVSLQGERCESVLALGDEEEIGLSLILGLRDYIRKCGFVDVVVGLSGGIDSAVTAAIAVEALGAEHVTGIAMPSQFSSQGSIDDARALAENLGIAFHVVPIAELYEPFSNAFNSLFGVEKFDITNENVQAGIRGRRRVRPPRSSSCTCRRGRSSTRPPPPASTATSSSASSNSSTRTSSSAARPPRRSACRRRRSAMAGRCRSRSAGGASRRR